MVGLRPKVKGELMWVVRNGRMSLKVTWKMEEGMGSKGRVVVWLNVTSLGTSSEERGAKEVRPTEVVVGGRRIAPGVMSFPFLIE